MSQEAVNSHHKLRCIDDRVSLIVGRAVIALVISFLTHSAHQVCIFTSFACEISVSVWGKNLPKNATDVAFLWGAGDGTVVSISEAPLSCTLQYLCSGSGVFPLSHLIIQQKSRCGWVRLSAAVLLVIISSVHLQRSSGACT